MEGISKLALSCAKTTSMLSLKTTHLEIIKQQSVALLPDPRYLTENG